MKRTWLITGVSSGLGREMLQKLLARGDRVAGTVRNLASMDQLSIKFGHNLWLAELDVTDTPGIRRTVDRAFAELGRIDVVVNNAGYAMVSAAEELTDEQVLRQLNTNLVGSIQVVRCALPHLRRQGGGRILQVSSVAGQVASPGAVLYGASKWGIEGFIDSLALEVAPFKIECTLCEPSAARTNFYSHGAIQAEKIPAYDISPARQARNIGKDGKWVPSGDPVKMAEIMLASVEQSPAPRRIALGKTAYDAMHKQLSNRLAELEAQRELAYSADSAVGQAS